MLTNGRNKSAARYFVIVSCTQNVHVCDISRCLTYLDAVLVVPDPPGYWRKGDILHFVILVLVWRGTFELVVIVASTELHSIQDSHKLSCRYKGVDTWTLYERLCSSNLKEYLNIVLIGENRTKI